MKIRRITAAATAVALAAALAACAPPEDEDGGDGDGNGGNADTSITVGWNQPFYSYNSDTSNGNATANSIILYLMNSGLNYYDANQELIADESFGSYELLSEDPLTVEYTIADGVEWSDGTPVDASDLLLAWAAGSGVVNTVEADAVERDESNYPVLDDGAVFFDSSSAGLGFTDIPEISEDGKSLTLTYSEPFADWEVQLDVGVPAHVTAMQALDIEDPQEAKDALVDAITTEDAAALSPIANFWNSGYDFTELPDDPSLYLSNGAYVLTDMVDGQYATLEANDGYTGERPAGIETVTVSWNEDPNAQVQQLENGEVDLMGPQATTDIVDALGGIDGVELETGVEGTYEHLDLVFNNGGPFDPATYGGDEATALAVRQAFLTALPRQDIIDRLIAPLQDGAEVRDSQLITPGAPGYDEIIADNGSDQYSESDPAAAQAILAEAGVTAPIDVRTMFAADNVRRDNIFNIIQPVLAEAGFNLVDARNADWGSKLGDGTYDAVYFGWQSTSTAVTESQATFGTGGLNNLNGFSDPEVDALFDQLAVTTDEDEQIDIQTQIDTILFDAAYGLTLFQFPSVAAWNTDRLEGVEPAPLNPTIFYGYWNWSVPE
ncbi:ABC transporter family substrate-binding protein [Nocardioides alkalitolerans]|uniref:ABC transporter family substrate-binding protein n=1 Tax=Nocardioides alkalitolerans TaxID=281714 RepID=UPI000428C468|nr:ABC transporter family substrate-binding protein [Nocardioides alkalitolerans]